MATKQKREVWVFIRTPYWFEVECRIVSAPTLNWPSRVKLAAPNGYRFSGDTCHVYVFGSVEDAKEFAGEVMVELCDDDCDCKG